MENDYKEKYLGLLSAMHSVIWYEGILDAEYDETGEMPVFIDLDKNGNDMIRTEENWKDYVFSIPKYDKNSVIFKLIDDLLYKEAEYEFYTLKDAEQICSDFSNSHPGGGRYNTIWQLLVELFGNCGTSPRTGWIEKRKECADFLLDVVNIERIKIKEGY